METEKNYLEQNIARLLKQTHNLAEPDAAFKDSLINSVLKELEQNDKSKTLSMRMNIDHIMRIAAMIAIVFGAVFELLLSVLVWSNAGLASAISVAAIMNGLTHLGGIIL